MNRIVVGVDGSESAAEALRWAVDQARLTGATIEAVYAWDPDALVSPRVPPLPEWEAPREVAQARPAEIVRKAVGDEKGVRILTKMVRVNAAEALADHSAQTVCSSSDRAGSSG